VSDSRQQERFFEAAIKTIRSEGCEVFVERNKHFKATISANNQKKLWTVSTTPRNRRVAQQEAISDLKKVLRELGIPVDQKRFREGMLHMMSSVAEKSLGQQLDQLIEVAVMIDSEKFKNALSAIYPELSQEEVFDLAKILEIFTESFDGFGNLPDSSDGWSVLRPAESKDEISPLVCSRRIIIPASDKNRYLPYKWKHAFDFESAIKTLFKVFEICEGTTGLGVVVTNVWRPSVVCKYQKEFERFLDRGQKTVFLLSSGRVVLPVSLPWR
jgi:hypothetical protein